MSEIMDSTLTDPHDFIKDYFNQKASTWDELCFHEPDKLSRILSLCRISPGQRILDICTGTGVLIPLLIESGAGFIKGIDISRNMIARAEEKFSHPHVRFEVGNIYDFEEAGWDRAVIYSAYPHLMDRPRLAETLNRLLIPGGRFLVAHSESRRRINNIHSRHALKVSSPLQSAEKEASFFRGGFDIDTIIDSDELYLFSGVKKS